MQGLHPTHDDEVWKKHNSENSYSWFTYMGVSENSVPLFTQWF